MTPPDYKAIYEKGVALITQSLQDRAHYSIGTVDEVVKMRSIYTQRQGASVFGEVGDEGITLISNVNDIPQKLKTLQRQGKGDKTIFIFEGHLRSRDYVELTARQVKLILTRILMDNHSFIFYSQGLGIIKRCRITGLRDVNGLAML